MKQLFISHCFVGTLWTTFHFAEIKLCSHLSRFTDFVSPWHKLESSKREGSSVEEIPPWATTVRQALKAILLITVQWGRAQPIRDSAIPGLMGKKGLLLGYILWVLERKLFWTLNLSWSLQWLKRWGSKFSSQHPCLLLYSSFKKLDGLVLFQKHHTTHLGYTQMHKKIKTKYLSQWWWCMPLISELRKQRQANGSLMSWRPAWSTDWVPGSPGLHRETLCWKTKWQQQN